MNMHYEARHLVGFLTAPALKNLDRDDRIRAGELIDQGDPTWAHLDAADRDLLVVAYRMSRLGDAFIGAAFDDQLRRNAGYCIAEGADVIVRCGQVEVDDGPF